MAETHVGRDVDAASAQGPIAATKSASKPGTSAHGVRSQGDQALDERRERATRRIRAKRGFWIHLGIYLAVNALLVLVWAMASGGNFWPAWPMLGWGIGLVAHAVRVFIGPWEISEERIERELRRGA